MPRRSSMLIMSAAIVCLASGAMASDDAIHDMECMGSVGILASSPDANVRNAAPAVYAFYLGRLNERGLTPEQIQGGMEKIALSQRGNSDVTDKDFAERCGSEVNKVIRDIGIIQNRDLAAMKQGSKSEPQRAH